MKKILFIIAIILSIFLVGCMGYEVDENRFTFVFELKENKEMEIKEMYSWKQTKEIIIPEQYQGYPVTRIADEAFKGMPIFTVTMPDTITYIGESAFEDCDNLRKIYISKSVDTIQKNTFKNCFSLEDIELPDTLKKIDESAFSDCKMLTSINLPDGSSQQINYIRIIFFCFFHYCCTSLERVALSCAKLITTTSRQNRTAFA